MVCTANDLLEWKDFPKGLRVLLLDQDIHSSTLITSKLQEMDYIVVAVFSEHEALSTIELKNESFHVAIVEVSAQNSDERYKFLETAKDLPTIMISKENCLRTMMKCIALGAVEFLIKPLSEDKLRNIWQHVVHKAFSTSERENSESLKSVKEFVGSVLKLQQFSNSTQEESTKEPDDDDDDDDIMMDEDEFEQLAFADKFPAPSTPQIKQGGRSVDDGDYHDQNNCSPPKESDEVEPENKFVDTTCENSYANMEEDLPQVVTVKEEDPSTDGSKGSEDSPPNPNDKDDDTTLRDFMDNLHKESAPQKSSRPKSNKKKMKVDWTPDLHKKFVQAVEQLGVDQAIPSRILELMKVDGLTRHNVASHLQKYRMNRRHILPKEDERRWPRPRDTIQRNYYTQRPVMAYPPYQTNHTYAPQPQVYPVWGHHLGGRPPGLPMWGPPPTYPWQPPESWHWKPYPAMPADAWGCPVMPPPHPGPPVSYPQVQATGPTYRFQSPDTYGKQSVDTHPGEEIIDRVVKEAISKPWLPLPIGLKPPSTDGVLAELSRQGISTVPPHQINNGRHEHC